MRKPIPGGEVPISWLSACLQKWEVITSRCQAHVVSLVSFTAPTIVQCNGFQNCKGLEERAKRFEIEEKFLCSTLLYSEARSTLYYRRDAILLSALRLP